MRIILVLMFTVLMSATAGCVFDMNDSYDKGVDGGGVYSISGKFIDKSGNAISGITVVLGGDKKTSELTDAAGAYVFADLSVGSYTVTPGNSGSKSMDVLVLNKDVDMGTNGDGHGMSKSGDYTCSGCH